MCLISYEATDDRKNEIRHIPVVNYSGFISLLLTTDTVTMSMLNRRVGLYEPT